MSHEKESIFNIIVPTSSIFKHFDELIKRLGRMNINHSLFLNFIINASLNMSDSEIVIDRCVQRSRIDPDIEAMVSEELIEYSRLLLSMFFGVWGSPSYDKQLYYVEFVELALDSGKDLKLIVHCKLYPAPP